jgi:hypothetical protein
VKISSYPAKTFLYGANKSQVFYFLTVKPDIQMCGLAALPLLKIPACGSHPICPPIKSKFVFLLPQKLPGAFGTGQTCLLRPLVAKGIKRRKVKELTDGNNSKNKY